MEWLLFSFSDENLYSVWSIFSNSHSDTKTLKLNCTLEDRYQLIFLNLRRNLKISNGCLSQGLSTHKYLYQNKLNVEVLCRHLHYLIQWQRNTLTVSILISSVPSELCSIREWSDAFSDDFSRLFHLTVYKCHSSFSPSSCH